MALLETLLAGWLAIDEAVGAVLGVLVVVCLVREKLLAWPLGVLYVLVILPQLWASQAYASFLLHLFGFLPLNLYGWYHWLFGGEARDDLPVTRCAVRTLALLGGLALAGGALLGWLMASQTDAAMPYWDNGLLVMSLAAMWLTAQKKIENWIVWLVVNVISVPFYYALGLPLYAALYVAYIAMAVWGYLTWQRSLLRHQAGGAAAAG